jgi:hypothetical protein
VQADSVVAALERFFLDIVGTVLPGGAFLLALSALAGDAIEVGPISLVPGMTNFSWPIFVFAAYAGGHVVTSVGENILIPVLEWFVGKFKEGRFIRRLFEPDSDLTNKIADSSALKALESQLTKRGQWSGQKADLKRYIRDLRSVAMTIAKEDTPTVYRFRFLSLMNLGLATVLAFTAGVWILHGALHGIGRELPGSAPSWWGVALMLLLCPFFLERRYMFYGMSQRVPFSMAVGKLVTLDSPSGKARADGSGS